MGFIETKSNLSRAMLLPETRGKSVSFSVPVSRGHVRSLAYDPSSIFKDSNVKSSNLFDPLLPLSHLFCF